MRGATIDARWGERKALCDAKVGSMRSRGKGSPAIIYNELFGGPT